jgi:hypothetical protein
MSQTSRRFPFAHAFSQLLRVILPVATIAMGADLAQAQNERTISEGSRVEISVPGSKKVKGVIKSRTADSTTVFVEGYGGTRSFLNSDMTELKISRGRTHMEGAKKGALWGGAVGGVVAIAVLATPEGDSDYEYGSQSNNEIAAQSLLGGLIWGVGLGAIIKAEQWDKVPVHPHFAVSPASGSIGMSVAFSPSFLH